MEYVSLFLKLDVFVINLRIYPAFSFNWVQTSIKVKNNIIIQIFPLLSKSKYKKSFVKKTSEKVKMQSQ